MAEVICFRNLWYLTVLDAHNTKKYSQQPSFSELCSHIITVHMESMSHHGTGPSTFSCVHPLKMPFSPALCHRTLWIQALEGVHHTEFYSVVCSVLLCASHSAVTSVITVEVSYDFSVRCLCLSLCLSLSHTYTDTYTPYIFNCQYTELQNFSLMSKILCMVWE